jgi:molybdate/tungstate transport system substrate-binding protein
MRPKRVLCAVLAGLLGCALLANCAPREKTALKVLFAGSLIIPFGELEKAYEATHPDIDVQMEGHGSIQVIRHVTEIHDLVDVAAPADHALIPMLMYASRDPETGQPYASWYAKFATNRLVLAYRPKSRYASEINADNWYEILQRPDVRFGMSDPRFDAAGYRTLMVMQMAEWLYDEPTLFEELISSSFRARMRTNLEGDMLVIRVPELLEVRDEAPLVLRAYSIQIIALLESGDVDYTLAYESVARQHGLETIALPDTLNLGAEERSDDYAKVQVQLDFQRFASVQPTFQGEVIAYGVTIPSNAPHPKEAEAFVAFLLGPEGQQVLQDNHQPTIDPAQAHNYEAFPEALRPLCVPMP